ncbi:MAG: hypothetical protein VX627_07055 [Candidatus Thermoplasmatota archaeon]|nr:hypothetical protein [Candidatus Thermoplasmatota archaeon]
MEFLHFPSIPPSSPYEAYLLVLIIPFMFRMVMVLPPLIDLIEKFGGDAKWYWGRIRQIRVKGLGLLLLNESLALILPFILAFYARTVFNPLGWPDWETTPDAGVWVLLFAGFLWLWADLLRVARTRRLLRSVSEKNPIIAKTVVQAAATARTFLDRLRVFSPLDMHSDVVAADDVMEGKPEPEPENVVQKIARHVKDTALIAAETVAEITRGKAEEVSENLDSKIDVGVRSHAKTSLKLLLRDIVMSLAPIAILVLLHQLW